MVKNCVENCRKLAVWDLLNNQYWIKYSYEQKGYVDLTLIRGEGKQKTTKPIRLFFEETPCNYGGYRIWFKCPGCSRRVGVLYSNGWSLGLYCRHCLDLTYRDRQHKGGMFFEVGRIIRKQNKIKEKIAKKRLHMKTIIKLIEKNNILSEIGNQWIPIYRERMRSKLKSNEKMYKG